MAGLADFATWVNETFDEKFVQEVSRVSSEGDAGDGSRLRRFFIYTSRNRYSIVAIERKTDEGYIGCQAQARTPRAGEHWHRGNDLPDGSLSRETWDRILRAILSYELVRVNRQSEKQ